MLVVFLGENGTIGLLEGGLQLMKRALPAVSIQLMHRSDTIGKQVAPLIDAHMRWPFGQPSRPNSGTLARKTVKRLQDRSFDAAVLFTKVSGSPYLAAYLCYLAGIPIRAGLSQEFGGGVLSHRVEPPPDSVTGGKRYIYLMESLGFLPMVYL